MPNEDGKLSTSELETIERNIKECGLLNRSMPSMQQDGRLDGGGQVDRSSLHNQWRING